MRWYSVGTAMLMMFVSMPVAGQRQERRSADDYACLLGGDCSAAPPSARRAAPDPSSVATQRFVLAPPPVDLRLSFASGSAALTPAAMAEARVIASALNRPRVAARRLRIEGHTDSRGSRTSNLRLSRRRADAVVAYLAREGVARSRLVAIGHGFDRPLPGVRAAAPENRRVIAVVMP